jgi:hypothetical protein
MKQNTLTMSLVILAIAFFWSCNEETITPQQQIDGELELRDHRPNHNPPGQGNGNEEENQELFSVTYDGDLFISQEGFYRFVRNNPKYNLMGSEDCHPFRMLSGINEILDHEFGIDDCYPDDEIVFCSPFHSIRQFNKKDPTLIRRVAAHFTFYDYTQNTNQHRLSIHGNIKDMNTAGEYSIFPTNEGEVVEIILDKWRLGGSDNCNTAGEFIFFSDMTPIVNPQHITIKRLAPGDCPAVPTCSFSFP